MGAGAGIGAVTGELKPGVTSTPTVDSPNMFNANVGMSGQNLSISQADQITPLYQSLLKREPDEVGLQSWQNLLNETGSLESVRQGIMNSEEYLSNNPGARYTNNTTLGTGQTSNPYSASTNPYIQASQATTLGNLYGAQAATAANRVNQYTPYANLQYTQTGTDAQGNPTWAAVQNLAQPFQQSLSNIQNQLAQSTATPFDISQYQAGQVGQGPQFSNVGSAQQAYGVGSGEAAQRMGQAPQLSQVGQGPQFNRIGNAANLQSQVQGTGMEGWDKATGLLMSRLNPQIQQSQDRLTAQLANQGIVPGTEAYNRAMTQQGQKTNDLLTQAQLAGSQVQNTMFGQNLAAGQFGNQALTQQNQNQLANLGFNNQAGQQGYQNLLAAQQANNQALLGQNQAQLANVGLNNQAIAQNFGQNLSAQQLQNQAAQQNYANLLSGTNFNNQAAQQGYANQLAGTQANNAARQQNYQQALAQRNLPLQQLGAFQQATTPGYINPYSQAAVAGPDYLGAYTTSRAADIAQQNAQAAKTANLQSGLFGLGSSAVLGAGGIGNLGSSVLGGASSLGGLLGLTNYGLDSPFVSSADYMSNIGATGSGLFDQTMSSNDYLNSLYGDFGIF
jgi:hypothetical protein